MSTKDGISITAASYSGTVTLETPFAMHTYSRLFFAGDVQDNSLLAGGTLTRWNGEVRDWQMLQMAINGAPSGTTITLSDNCYASTTDSALHVDSSKNLTIDLNGHTLDRGLADGDGQAEMKSSCSFI